MLFHEWQQTQRTQRKAGFTSVANTITSMKPSDLAKVEFEKLDMKALELFPQDPMVKKLVKAANALSLACRTRDNEKTPRLNKGKGKLVKRSRYVKACAIAVNTALSPNS
jgi:hypothetical protein